MSESLGLLFIQPGHLWRRLINNSYFLRQLILQQVSHQVASNEAAACRYKQDKSQLSL